MHNLRHSGSVWKSVVVWLAGLQFGLCSLVDVTVDVQQTLRELKHFWKSTGFCPPLPHTEAHRFDLSTDQEINLALVGSVPFGGIQQVRIHWLLELVSVSDGKGGFQYNFTHLDNLMDLLWHNGLKPGFELMGSVSNAFSNFEDQKQVAEWRNLVYLTAKRYIGKYGLSTVSQWNFETWNEPNNHDFDNVTMTIQGFLNYYDACSEGLRDASATLRFGGPGDSCHEPPSSPYCWAMLQHCYNGTNFFTRETGVRLDYIALHKKGGGFSLPILHQETVTVKEIQARFPGFRSLPIFNDEADPMVGWSKPLEWRADVTYAAMVVKVISQHQNLLIADKNNTINYTLLSNDNAFLSYYPHQFTQRTLTARFQVNSTQPPHVQFLRKPVLTAMGLLALLGETQVEAQVKCDSCERDSVGVLASVHHPRVPFSTDSWQVTVLLYNSRDTQTPTAPHLLSLHLTGFSSHRSLMYVEYHLNNIQSSPYSLWVKMGSPAYPTAQQFRELRDSEDALRYDPVPFPAEGNLTLRRTFPVPSLILIHVCSQPDVAPDQVNGLRFISITKGQVLIIWRDHCIGTKCIKTYEVEFSKDKSVFHRINTRDTIFTSYTFSPENLDVTGFYRVRAVDYWDRSGEYSLVEWFSQEHR
ncbi:alpha-L-iduronidase [Chanos chanos]|uniref:Alpha-L-iduronidase n=1 Tax=Chanos chanos TaxID=29144 RepID=A0A6J2WTE9_CHACN|nr:alpha-L-iduronidase [Chanos chanos]